MNRYLIQSSRYTGSVELIYNGGILQVLDFSQTNMLRPAMVEAFKKTVAVEEQYLKNSFSTDVTIIKADVIITFQMFWDKYGNKVNRLRAEKLFNALSTADAVAAFCGIAPYERYLVKTGYRNKADPDTYLRNKYWLNEYK